MKKLRRLTGMLAMILGLIGVILSATVVVGSWRVGQTFTDAVLQMFPPIEQAIVSAEEALQSTGDFVTDKQEEIGVTNPFSRTIGQATDTIETIEEAAPMAEELVEDAQQVKVLLETAENTFQSALAFANAVNQLPFIDISETISKTSGLFDQLSSVHDKVETVEDNAVGVVDQVQQRTVDASEKMEQIDGELQKLDGALDAADAQLDQYSDEIAKLKERIPTYISLAPVILTLLALWFGWAQFALMRNGWRRWRSGRR